MTTRSRAAVACVAAVALVAGAIVLFTAWPHPPEQLDPGDGGPNPEVVPDPRRPYSQADTVPLPDGSGDTVGLDRDARDANRAWRRDPAGRTKWSTPLDGYLGLVRPPHFLADAERVYVTHADGVTTLDGRTGVVAWRSPGPADRMLLSGDLLLATECSVGESIAKRGRCVVARSAATGAEVFRVALPLKGFDPLPIEEAAGLFLVQDHDPPGGGGLALLIDRGGQVHHRFDRQVVAVARRGKHRMLLTCRDVVLLSEGGEVRWSVPFRQREWLAGGELVPLPGGGAVAFLYCQIADRGVQVLRLDPARGEKVWEADCVGLGVTHSAYSHDADVAVADGKLKVISRGSGGTFVEELDLETGRQLSREVRKR